MNSIKTTNWMLLGLVVFFVGSCVYSAIKAKKDETKKDETKTETVTK